MKFLAMWVWVKKPVPKWVARVSGNMDQNPRNPSWSILTHTHVGMGQTRPPGNRRFWSLVPLARGPCWVLFEPQ